MNLSDITKINFGSAGISAVYNGGIKLWPTGPKPSNKIMKFTTTDGNTWNNTKISAYTADNRIIQPIKKDATGWTYDEEVGYLTSNYDSSKKNLLTFEGFPKAVKFKSGANFFYNNDKCTDISTANIDTSECTAMNSMFNKCSGLISLDLSNFNTSQVTTISGMFSGCSGLTSLNVSNFNTSKVTDMNSMFQNCSSLTSLDLSNFDTSKVTNMSQIFSACMGLTSLNVSNFNISKVTDMSFMFYYCKKLTSLDLSNWNIMNSTSTTNMFRYCSSLTTVKMTNCSQATKDKIRAALDAAGLTNVVITE